MVSVCRWRQSYHEIESGRLVSLGTPDVMSFCRRPHWISGYHFTNGVESPRGISPRGAHRTVREPLDSHGSCQPFADHLAVIGRRPLKPAPPACAVGQF